MTSTDEFEKWWAEVGEHTHTIRDCPNRKQFAWKAWTHRDAEHAQARLVMYRNIVDDIETGCTDPATPSDIRDALTKHDKAIRAEHAQERERLLGIFGDYDHEITDVETAEAIWNEMRARECRKDERIALLEMERAKDANRIITFTTREAQAAEREQAAVAAALRDVAAKLDRVAEGYASGGHSHRAQMLHALAKETQTRITPAHESALDRHDQQLRSAWQVERDASIAAALREAEEIAADYSKQCRDRIAMLITPAQQAALDNMLAEAKREGAKEMRERAAIAADEYLVRTPNWNSYHQDAQLEIARVIRALPLDAPSEQQ